MSGGGIPYQLGPNTLSVSRSLHAENRERLCKILKEAGAGPGNFIVVQGGVEVPLHNTDIVYIFQQEPYFHWLFGVREANFFGIIDMVSGKSSLFIPHLPEEYSVWMGKLTTCDEVKRKYGVDDVFYTKEIAEVLSKKKALRLLRLKGENSDSGLTLPPATFEGIDRFQTDDDLLYPAIAECRVFKTRAELDVLRYANRVSSDAHKVVMRSVKPGLSEFQMESVFLNHVYFHGGCRHVAYNCICGSGENGAVLHYGHAAAPNERVIKDGDMCLFDMGGSYYGYASDITCSFPANGKFSDDQRAIYETVLRANRAVMSACKPGVSWVEMHKLANRVTLEGLTAMGLLKGSVDEMMDVNLGAVFQPHGLGHFMGLDVHDVGGYLENCPSREERAGLRSLRTARVLQADMVLTIEPGCYFIDSLLDKALADPKQSSFIVTKQLERFRNFGGVRIEDDVIITKDGLELMTNVPRTVAEIEEYMAGKGDGKCYIPTEFKTRQTA